MSVELSAAIAAMPRQLPGFVSLRYVDLERLGVSASPIAVLDDFRVRDMPFSPHPHAGFAAVTYVFEDSECGVRSRTSSGVDLTVEPGGIVWTESGSGVVHEEIPAEKGRELHGIQLFVNVGSMHKLAAPRVLHLQPDHVPVFHTHDDERVRVVVGSFDGVVSPLVPIEPFTLLDAELQRETSTDLPPSHNAVIYVLSGSLVIRAGGRNQEVDGGHAIALRGNGAGVTIKSFPQAHFLYLSGVEIEEPVVAEGPFIMNDVAQIESALARYRSGAMGELAPLSRR
jgi:redox-sensitive bicupin YhaK (pirin superfamily)